jgi:hypothetical protein
VAVFYSLACVNARLQAVANTLNGGTFILTDPRTVSTIPLANPSGTVDGGVLTFTTPETDPSAALTGFITSAAFRNSIGQIGIYGFTVGIPVSGADVTITNGLNSTLISSGQVVQLLAAQIFEPFFTNIPIIILSNATIAANASIGQVIGALSIIDGSGRPYTFTLTSDPSGFFTITGSNLTVGLALVAGSYAITIKATDGMGSTVSQAFLITVTPSVITNTGLLFNTPANSMYIPVLTGIS